MNNAEMKVIRFDARDVIATSGVDPAVAYVTGHTHDPAATYHAQLTSKTPQGSYTYNAYDSAGTKVGAGYISGGTDLVDRWIWSSKGSLDTTTPTNMEWHVCDHPYQ